MMLTRALTFVVLALAATPAFALCQPAPENANSGYVANNVEHTLCLQRELAGDAAQRAELRKFELELNAMQMQLQLDRLRSLPTYDVTRP